MQNMKDWPIKEKYRKCNGGSKNHPQTQILNLQYVEEKPVQCPPRRYSRKGDESC